MRDARTARLRRVCAALLIVSLSSRVFPAQSHSSPPSGVLVEGEELVYNVRYTFIDLGQVRIRILKRDSTHAAMPYVSVANINSYRGVPFVDLSAIFESSIDTAMFSHAFVGKTKENTAWDFARYRFDYDMHRVTMEMGRKDTLVQRRDTLALEGRLQDGLSLFFFARDRLFSGRRMNVPCVIKERVVNTYIHFMGERKSVELDAVEYPVDVVGLEGTAEFVGIFGLTGDFEGWFSNDEARIPIVAKMRVIIGSVTLELMSWKRAGWVPPRGRE